ncbi:type 1 glutamine amidotransferase [Vibrio kanaloae]|uniref:type 1 glutamine amidotransferase n=1 Tax=Vibrio kanaloae TaxID=170673 RepID=UPI00148C6E13|nr:type 1 glutamine amidotransferase [Vibrio kanaloae]NOI98623.1 type 1 glutamine amidotransferase [Vibrio kanaloae]
MHIHFIIHEHFEAPGAYETWAQTHGYAISYSRVYLGDSLPTSIEDIDLLIVMGGPQNPQTSLKQCHYFDADAEQALISKAINARKSVLGVCLGSQLIGESLGATYQQSPEREIGKFPITLTQEGLTHPLFAHFDKELKVGHWHNDMPGLTPVAKVIAYSQGCPRQIVAYSDLVFGFQCHMELTKALVTALIDNDDLSNSKEHRFVEDAEVLLNHDYDEMNQKLMTFLDKLTDYYQLNPPSVQL